MATVALFHSVLGLRPGVALAADRLRAGGHEVITPDLLGGRVLDAYEPAMAHADELGTDALFARGLDAVADLPDGFVAAGFSLGSNVAAFVAVRRRAAALLQLAGVSVAAWFGPGAAWPPGLRSQAHQMSDDPFREPEVLAQAVVELPALEVYDYVGSGHLFTDPSLPDEHDPVATDLMWSRVLPFLRNA